MEKIDKQGEKRLFIGGLQHSVKHEDLLSFLRKYGQVKELILPKKAESNKCLGYGNFICDAATAERFINGCPLQFHKKKLSFKPFLSGHQLNSHLQDFNSKRVFLKNLPQKIKLKSLKRILKKIGNFTSVYIRSLSRQFGIVGVVMFETENKARIFCETVNRTESGLIGILEASHQFFAGTNFLTKPSKTEDSNSHFIFSQLFMSTKGFNQNRRIASADTIWNYPINSWNENPLVRNNNTKLFQKGFDFFKSGKIIPRKKHSTKHDLLTSLPRTANYTGCHEIAQNHLLCNLRLNLKKATNSFIKEEYGFGPSLVLGLNSLGSTPSLLLANENRDYFVNSHF
jgi:RNA recognition motif-containing protein